MGTFFVYILKTAFCLGGFYLFYRLLLTRDTFHRFNRVALLSILLLSLLLPFCQFTTHSSNEVQQAMLSWEQILMMVELAEASPVVAAKEQAYTLHGLHVVLVLYVMGVLFFIGRHLYSIGNLIGLIRRNKKETLPGGITLVVHRQQVSPFSWMRYIVISEKDLAECGREILAHESAHIRKLHSLDLLLADCCIFFQWFNPASWLLKQELQNIHEYEADDAVLKEGIDAKTYQLLLIKKAVGTRLYSMANSFNHSNLKKRITMMLKEKSNPWARMKYLYILPVAAIAVSAFARPEITSVAEEISAVKVSDLSAIVETNLIETPAVENVSADHSVQEKQEEVISHVQTVFAPDTIAPKENSVFDVVEEMPEFPGGMKAFMEYIEKNKKYPKAAKDADIHGRVIVQFIVTKEGSVSSPQVVRRVHPLLDAEALRLIRKSPKWKPGKQDGNPVEVRYTTAIAFLSENALDDDVEVVRYSSSNKEGIPKAEPLLIIDGEIISNNIMRAIDPNAIESIDVFKSQTSIEPFGEAGKNGVVVITLKEDKSTDNPDEDQMRVRGTGQLSGSASSISISKTPQPTEKYPMKVSGQVVDESGKPIVGALIGVKNAQVGTITDTSGNFTFYAPQDAVIVVQYIDKSTVEVKGSTELKIVLKPE